jgi:hypothetical protein
MESAWEGRVGLGQVGRTLLSLFPTQLPFHDSRSVPEKRPPPTTSSPTHLHDPSREPHPHTSLSIRFILLLAGRDRAGSGPPESSPHHVRSGAWHRASTDTTAASLPTLSAACLPPPLLLPALKPSHIHPFDIMFEQGGLPCGIGPLGSLAR